MDRQTLYAILLLGGAGAAYWYWQKKKAAEQPPQDQTPAMVAQQYYSVPPNIGFQNIAGGQTFAATQQAMPLPYNT